jgi:RTX calcium-binding nonapeptide repeat (4 copies)
MGGIEMATMTLTDLYDNSVWGPDIIRGGTVSAQTGTVMTYVSEQGYTVTFNGTGFSYDDDGFANDGVVTSIVVRLNGQLVFSFTNMTDSLPRMASYALGDNQDGPDPDRLFQTVLRGDDIINGSNGGNDIIANFGGGDGNDTINAGGGGDYIKADAGNDVIHGGNDDGFDVLTYDKTFYRGGGFQGLTLDTAAGTAIDPWGGHDTFDGIEYYIDSYFNDEMSGRNTAADGRYLFESTSSEGFRLSRGADFLDGRGGYDWLAYFNVQDYGASRGIRVNMATGTIVDPWKTVDTILNVESVTGTIFADSFSGSTRGDSFEGMAGIDSYDGKGGADTLIFWANTWNGGHGATVNLSSGVISDDGWGNTEVATAMENIRGSQTHDNFVGNAAANIIWGNQGNDTIKGGGNNDTIFGGEGNDALTGNAGADVFSFYSVIGNGVGVDTITDFDLTGGDLIELDGSVAGLSAQLTAAGFRSAAGATTATTADHRVIYNRSTGDLYVDHDGAGGDSAVLVAHLTNKALLTVADFEIWLG